MSLNQSLPPAFATVFAAVMPSVSAQAEEPVRVETQSVESQHVVPADDPDQLWKDFSKRVEAMMEGYGALCEDVGLRRLDCFDPLKPGTPPVYIREVPLMGQQVEWFATQFMYGLGQTSYLIAVIDPVDFDREAVRLSSALKYYLTRVDDPAWVCSDASQLRNPRKREEAVAACMAEQKAKYDSELASKARIDAVQDYLRSGSVDPRLRVERFSMNALRLFYAPGADGEPGIDLGFFSYHKTAKRDFLRGETFVEEGFFWGEKPERGRVGTFFVTADDMLPRNFLNAIKAGCAPGCVSESHLFRPTEAE